MPIRRSRRHACDDEQPVALAPRVLYDLQAMSRYSYRLINVFSLDGDPFSGNPLCVFENGSGLSDAQMQALALQFNLSETTFVLASGVAAARVRIFTPTFEMPFAGHPTLGSAHVVRQLQGGGTMLRLELDVGIVPVSVEAGRYTLQAKPPCTEPVAATHAELAAMLGLPEREIARALWVDTGSHQLLIELHSPDSVARCRPDPRALERHGRAREDRYLVYVFSPAGADRVRARYFFNRGSSVVEDPATGSACANLGGYAIARGERLPLRWQIEQGAEVGRPSRLELHVDAERNIFVSGAVFELGRGAIELPEASR